MQTQKKRPSIKAKFPFWEDFFGRIKAEAVINKKTELFPKLMRMRGNDKVRNMRYSRY